VWWGRLLGNEGQFEVVDDFVDHRKVCNKADDLHCATALRAEEGVNLLDFTDHLGPALGGDGPELVLSHPQGQGPKARLLDFPPVGVGVETVITDRDLALVGDMRGHPGDELQVVHLLHISGLFPIPVADLGFSFIEGEALQGKERPDHVLANSLGLRLSLGPHQAVDRKPRMPPGENTLRPLRAQKLLADKISQDLAGKDLLEPRVVDPRDLMEDARLVHSTLGHQVVQMGVEIDAVSEGLNGGDNPGRKRAHGHHLEIPSQ